MTVDTAATLESAPKLQESGFAAALRDHTQAVHREAERSGYIADLLRGRATKRGYALYLANLLPAYEVLESHVKAGSSLPALAAFAAPSLFRADLLRSDIQALVAATDDALAVLPEALSYAAAIQGAARGTGAGLVAHAYARYLGDLSGGQILKSLLARNLGLKNTQLRFYDFPDIADIAVAKTALREALDTIVVGSPDAEIIQKDAVAAFNHTIAVSNAVAAAMAKAG